ncbi:DUF4142 domain-containing protein [Microvirga rosea]|uniref:DUF4142 domain-containing protein n=1 Tax=Microvirga rosea TaxID=2715425 RepID=UPI001D0AD4D6|nr:DUF4142 domain-containing protein [Microvirga rosea]MCB8821103.1 DUF4142 domain-containing protein [Microvirga rosea]
MSASRLFIVVLSLAGVPAGMITAVSAQGQGAPTAPAPVRPIEPQEFLRLAYSSTRLQLQAAKLAAARETRPEVKTYASASVDFRQGQLQRLEAFAQARGIPLPAMKEFEHRVIIENLEPLDYLALSRRYAEVQLQALDQELTIYRAASQSQHQEMKAFADQIVPELQKQRQEAQKMYEAVRP